VNGLTRAARKSNRVGADGDLARYQAESYDSTIRRVSRLFYGVTNARWYRRSFIALVPASNWQRQGLFCILPQEFDDKRVK